MNVAMYNSPAVKRNLEVLRGFENTTVLESPAGELACGEVGQGRLMEPAEIVKWLEASDVILSDAHCAESKDLPAPPEPPAFPVAQDVDPTLDATLPGHGKKVLLTAGRTEEAIDPVRYISNRSSGKTAVALASVFYANGFQVEVVAGPMEAAFPGGVQVTRVQSAREMHDAVMERIDQADAVVHCAAVADYRPAHAADAKIKDSRSQLTIELVPNPNILRDCTAARASRNQNSSCDQSASRNQNAGASHTGKEAPCKKQQVIVGFALETDHFEQHAAEKLAKSGADALLLNAPVASDSGFGHDCVRYTLVRPGMDVPEMKMGGKVDLAQEIVAFVIDKLRVSR
jgi:phosphopantothenoylcysteine decarboxylase/phosphopantothenate--cysteine ligase